MNDPKKPLVSVIIPVYNGEPYLAGAIDSVLNQTYQPIQLILVNDGSTDGSRSIMERYPAATIIDQPNQGVAVARNTGLAAADGDMIALLDQDDVWLPHKLARQVDYLMQHPDMGYVLAYCDTFHNDDTPLPQWVRPSNLATDQPAYLVGLLLARRWVFDKVGNFDSAYRNANDSDWFTRASDMQIPMAILPEILLRKRIHTDNESRHVKMTQQELLTVMRNSVKRKRAANE